MSQNENDWIHDPSLKNIDPSKLEMLLSMAGQGKNKSQNELLPFLLAAASKTRSSGNSFSQDETDLIMNVLKRGKKPEEIAKIDKITSLVKMMQTSAHPPK